MMSEDECIENCLLGCSLLHCFEGAGKKVERFSVCLPNSTPAIERENRCSAFAGVTLTSWQHCNAPSENEVLGSGWIVFISLSVPVFFFVIGNVIYYRFEIHKKGRPPYDVPRWMPQFIFPRATVFGRNSESMQELVG